MIRHFVSSALMGLLVASNGSVLAQEAVRLYAAGSLRVALTEVAVAFEKQEGIPVATEFGASGLLRERIEKGLRRKCLPRPTWDIPRRCKKQVDPGRSSCLRVTGFARLRHPRWT